MKKPLVTLGAFALLSFVGMRPGAAVTPETAVAVPAEAPLKAEIIDLAALNASDLGPVLFATLRSKTLVSTPEGSVSVQTGNAPKHTHRESIEIQYVISGSGTVWLDDGPRQVHAGDLIVVPKGVVHGGSVANGPEFKMIAIKLPPSVQGDVRVVP